MFWLGAWQGTPATMTDEGNMNPIKGPFRLGALFLLVAGALHLLAWIPGGFTSQALWLISYGMVFVLLAFGLGSGRRWIAYIAFLVAIVAGIGALGEIWALSSIPAWLFVAAIAALWLCAASLFVALWRGPIAVETDT